MEKYKGIKYRNYSIVLAVYNGEDSIENAIDSVFDLNYPKNNYELIVVDDGSTDQTKEILKKLLFDYKEKGFHINVISNNTNQGRIKARITAATNAKYDNILIMDTQLVLQTDALERASQYDLDTNIISNVFMDKHRSIDDRVLYLIRKKLYAPYWGTEYTDVEINESNFNKISKGTGGFITQRKLFLQYSKLLEGSKNENDDTKILKEYINSGQKLIRSSKIRLLYKNRKGIDSLKHLFNRGPKFVDFYLSFKLITIGILILPVAALLLLICAALISKFIILFILLFFLILFGLTCIILSENFADFIHLFLYLPVIILTFSLGVYWGTINKLFGK